MGRYFDATFPRKILAKVLDLYNSFDNGNRWSVYCSCGCKLTDPTSGSGSPHEKNEYKMSSKIRYQNRHKDSQKFLQYYRFFSCQNISLHMQYAWYISRFTHLTAGKNPKRKVQFKEATIFASKAKIKSCELFSHGVEQKKFNKLWF